MLNIVCPFADTKFTFALRLTCFNSLPAHFRRPTAHLKFRRRNCRIQNTDCTFQDITSTLRFIGCSSRYGNCSYHYINSVFWKNGFILRYSNCNAPTRTAELSSCTMWDIKGILGSTNHILRLSNCTGKMASCNFHNLYILVSMEVHSTKLSVHFG